MSKELTKKAVEMLLKGATLVSDPCPYCKGVRILKDGSALCVTCGKEDKKEKVETVLSKTEQKTDGITNNLEKKIKDLTEELQKEARYWPGNSPSRTLHERREFSAPNRR